MLTYPIGVEEIINPATGALGPVLGGAWKNFTYLGNAQPMLQQLLAGLPGVSLELVNGSVDEPMFVYQFSGAPQIYLANGQDAQGNVISELIGYIIDRQTKPAEFVDENIGPGDTYPAGAKLQMNLEVAYGYAQFFWSDPNPPKGVTLKKRMSLATQIAYRSAPPAEKEKIRAAHVVSLD